MFQFSTEEDYRDGQAIFEEGNSGDWIYVILEGAVEISKAIEEKEVVIEILKTGEVFGELGFITKNPRTASARAVGDTRVGIIDRNFLDHEFNKLSSGFKTVLQSLAMRLIKTTEVAMQVKKRRTGDRVPKVLSLGFKTKARFVDAFSDNLSADGIFVRTSNPLPKGEKFLLELSLPNESKPINIDCEVRWSQTTADDPSKRHPGMGVNFVNISKTDHQKLKTLLSGAGPSP
jgi:uncharacterized protein (TIGR02266 family)